jgi:hemoglobin
MAIELKITPYTGKLIPVQRIPANFFSTVGEEKIRQFINIHYEYIKVSQIKHLFPIHSNEAFENAKQFAADFIIQVSGGPDYFNKSRGAPMLKKRHLPFAITPEARDIWLQLYIKALMEVDIPEDILEGYWVYLDAFSIAMINTPSKK